MKLNEHESKQLLAEAEIPIPMGTLINSAKFSLEDIGFELPWVVKAQVLCGARGKSGGIRKVGTLEQAKKVAQKILSMRIKQEAVPFVRIEKTASVSREIYISLSVHRPWRTLVFTCAAVGGINIESSKESNILTQKINIVQGLQEFQIRRSFFHIQLDKQFWGQFYSLINNLYFCFIKKNLLLAEINPLCLDAQNNLIALDGKIEIDNNFIDIKPELNKFYTPEHHSLEENRARQAGLSYHKLQGQTGLMVNGAGLAMATMDALNFAGLPAANFLDLGGGADEKRMATAFDILFADSDVKNIFLNMFGGILSCEKVAQAMSQVLQKTGANKPIVIRFSGNSADKGRKVIQTLNLDHVYLVPDLNSALAKLAELRPAIKPKYSFYQDQTEPVKILNSCQNIIPARQALPDKKSGILVQGITGKEGRLHTKLMQNFGSNIVAGVTPFKQGEQVLGIPVYNTVNAACAEHEIQASIIFVPPKFAADAIQEAVHAQIPWIICITEGIPQHDMLRLEGILKNSNSYLIGPNTPGLVVPEQTKIGIMPGDIFKPGPVAVFSRSGTLTYECVFHLSQYDIGQSLCVGIGGDPFVGTSFIDLFELIRGDSRTRAVVVIGEIGGTAEEELAAYLQKTGFNLPIFGFIAGQTAPPGKRLGHAGAILEEGQGGVQNKLKAMQAGGIDICKDLAEVAQKIQRAIN